MPGPPEGPRPSPGDAAPTDEPTATVGGASSASEAPRSAGPTLARGAAVGRYLVISELAAGGMGTVYAAYDPELDRRVALKLVDPAGRASLPPARLLREAQALARLAHPNVLTIYDAGVTDGAVFLACELVEGTSLHTWLRGGRRSRREVLRAFSAAGRGLAAAHDAGLVHRDFKPANVMIDRDGRVLVVDFGLARAASPSPGVEGGVVPLAELGTTPEPPALRPPAPASVAAGTPAYMAPEQRAGGEAVPASDQYAFCVALTEALSGQRPPVEGDVGAWARRALRRQPQRLRRALERGLHPDPTERHASMPALVAILERDPWRARRRAAAAGLGVALVAFAAVEVRRASERRRSLCRSGEATMAAVWNPGRREALEASLRASGPSPTADFGAATTALDRYAVAWQEMHRSACEATHVAGTQSPELLDLRMACLEDRRRELEALLSVLERDGSGPAEAVEAAQSLTPVTRCADVRALLATVPPPDPATAPEVARVRDQLAGSEALERLGRYAEGVADARRLATRAEELGYWPLTAEVLLEQGILEERGSDRGAAGTLGRAVDAAVAGGADRTAAEALVHLVRVEAYQLADHERARYYGSLATAALARLGEPAELAADLADHLGRLAFQEGELESALTLHRRALELRRRALGEHHPEVGSTLLRLAAVHAERGELDEAGRLAERAVELYRAGYGDGHPRLAVGLVQLGDIHYRRGDLAAAEAAQRQALGIREATLGPDHVQTAEVRLRLANTLLQGGRSDEARDLLERVRTVFAVELGSDHPRMADVLSSLGSIDLARGEHRRAGERFRQALAIQERAYGPDHPWVANTLYNLGLVAKAAGDPAVARQRFERALSIWEDAYGADHPLVGHALTALGQALIDLGRPAEAIAPLERALRLRQAEGTDPALVASTRFTLARALTASGSDRARAGELATAALEGFRRAGDAAGEAEVTAWLADQGGTR